MAAASAGGPISDVFPIIRANFRIRSWRHYTYTAVPFFRMNMCVRRSLPIGYSGMRTITHYERLRIDPPSNAKEIKLAYFKRAKECHPDLHGDAKKREFQELSQSYQVLGDLSKKAEYDRIGNQNVDDGRHGGTSRMEEKEASEVFHDVFRELGVRQYFEDLDMDVRSTYDKARMTGDYRPFWDLMKERKGLVLGILVPSLVVFRAPWLAMAFSRGVIAFGMPIVQFLLRNEKIRYLVLGYIWMGMKSAAARVYQKISNPPPPRGRGRRGSTRGGNRSRGRGGR